MVGMMISEVARMGMPHFKNLTTEDDLLNDAFNIIP
jgi:hypothetical protein